MVREGCSLLVRNLRFKTSPGQVRDAFERVGKVRDVYLPLDHYSGKPRGFGFVEFLNEQDAQEAIRELDKTTLDGNEISIIVAQDRRKSPDTMRRFQHPSTDSQSRRRVDYERDWSGSSRTRRDSGRDRHDYGKDRRDSASDRRDLGRDRRDLGRDRRDSGRDRYDSERLRGREHGSRSGSYQGHRHHHHDRNESRYMSSNLRRRSRSQSRNDSDDANKVEMYTTHKRKKQSLDKEENYYRSSMEKKTQEFQAEDSTGESINCFHNQKISEADLRVYESQDNTRLHESENDMRVSSHKSIS